MSRDEAGADADTTHGRSDRRPPGGARELPTATIVEAVGAAKNREPTDLPPLHHYVDTDALNALLVGARRRSESVCASFEYDGCEVVVEADSSIDVWVTPLEDG